MIPADMPVIEQDIAHPGLLTIGTRPIPSIRDDEVLIKVAAAGVNRADILQRQGKYPPPAGASDLLGLEISGTVAMTGKETQLLHAGDSVCALMAGGGYAGYVAVPEVHCLPVPPNIPLTQAAILPEAVATVYATLFQEGRATAGETALIHGGASGIGTMAIQMLKRQGLRVFVTVGTADKAAGCRALGADLAVNYKGEDFVAAVKTATNSRGVDIVLDMVGSDYVNRNLSILAHKGRHISIAAQQGRKAEIDLALVMRGQLTLTGSTLRGRSKDEKSFLIRQIKDSVWRWIADGSVKPVLDSAFPLKNADEAHKRMESGAHIGKIALEVS